MRIEVGGETAATGEAITATTDSIASFAPIMLIVTLVLLVLFLSAAIAPLYPLAARILALFATLGVTVWIFQHQLGNDGLVYYVPFTVGVLLISLGADYNVFVVGRIWEEAAGIVIDTVVARSMLVPALVALFGGAGMWPGRSRARVSPHDRDVQPEAEPRPSLSGRVAGLWSRER